MTSGILEIQPRELRFTFELKKQSSCSVQLANKSDQYVAFKVKTTSPKKYCVRPNIGIIKPKATCDFKVTMQAQKTAPPDLFCKDKFLVQSTVVPFGTTEEDMTSDMSSEVVSDYEAAKNIVGSKATTELDADSKPANNSREVQSDKDSLELKLKNEFEGLKSKLEEMDSKLREADRTIMKLNEERSTVSREKNMLKHELEMLRKKKNNIRRVQVGFPLLYVCMIALISLATGYFIHK